MADVHRIYDIFDDCYIIRVQGSGLNPNDKSENLFRFTGRSAAADSYTKLRALTLAEQKKDPKSKMIDHANAT